ncbi:Lactoylglutathione lyase @ Cadmium-induced protein CadI [hydrothermal vent metagenome]|uniref:Lactoylglutathione lyase @ Cadmium-induced protein CadI n=1 Tax=hydrothermal vent metagenome TaxID=652676 RepID=A0A1W1CIF4_9ZZZZ
MKTQRKLHMHISVDSIEQSIEFYVIQFGEQPIKIKSDYAQWIIDDLSLNFAISTRGYKKGVNHLGIQYESDDALQKAQILFQREGIIGKEDKGAVCCYKESNKYWVEDPTGMVWENYYSMKDVEIFGEDEMSNDDVSCKQPSGGSACCEASSATSQECCSQSEDGSACSSK